MKQTRAAIYRSTCTDAEEKKKSGRAKNELQQQLSFFAGGTGKDLAYLNNQTGAFVLGTLRSGTVCLQCHHRSKPTCDV
ncbi:unnamed protein product [Sphagnum balticum]